MLGPLIADGLHYAGLSVFELLSGEGLNLNEFKIIWSRSDHPIVKNLTDEEF